MWLELNVSSTVYTVSFSKQVHARYSWYLLVFLKSCTNNKNRMYYCSQLLYFSKNNIFAFCVLQFLQKPTNS